MSISSFSPGSGVFNSTGAHVEPYNISQIWTFYGYINQKYINNTNTIINIISKSQEIKNFIRYLSNKEAIADAYLKIVNEIYDTVSKLDPRSPTHDDDVNAAMKSISIITTDAIKKQENNYKKYYGQDANLSDIGPLGKSSSGK